MKKILNFIGIGVGILILIFAVMVFSFDANVESPSTDKIKQLECADTSYEFDEAYGGDAYTGIQNAAAQAANNMIAVNDSIKQTNQSLEAVNANIINQANAEADNAEKIIAAVQYFFGFLLLSIGILTILKHIEGLVADISTPQESVYDPEPSVSSAPPASSAPPQVPSWTCSCGRENAGYVSTCVCGVSRRELL